MTPRSRILTAALVGMAVLGSPLSASAEQETFWLWSGPTTQGGSGREVVRFNPQFTTGQVVVSFGDRRLYFIQKTGEAISYPIAIPREQSRWQGLTNVTQKRENPSWTPTPEMRRENPRLPNWVPGGHPMNPLGVRALYLGSSMYRIHGTDAPWTIGSAVSKGCIRMYNQDVLDLYPRVNVGAKVTVTWQTFKSVPVASSSSSSPSSDDSDEPPRRSRRTNERTSEPVPIPKRGMIRRSSTEKTRSADAGSLE